MTLIDSNSARINNLGEVPYIEFPPLSEIPFITHGFSTRLGGVSSGMFSSLNLGSGSSPYKDDPENIRKNFIRIADSIGVDPDSLVISDQVHKTDIRLVDNKDRGKGFTFPRDYKEIDGLITNTPGITLVTKYADCVPLFFVDPVNKAIGLSHAGWKGTVGRIGQITVEEMVKSFDSNPKDIIAVIGPSICMDCYEIGEEVANEFRKAFLLVEDYKKEDDETQAILVENNRARYQLNLWEANRRVLLESGLGNEHIHISKVCTSCNSELLFSHRKTKGKRGSLAAFLALSANKQISPR
ncbi:MAG: peptidoglycan editing factor PgeF [Anaerolineaceae bacterium]|nr:MAG: peptidoglycan editing factor PgeF [Anaerolineaceae bacterium]